MQAVRNGLAFLARVTRNLGPYLLLEIVLPGGTLMALLLFLSRQGKGLATGEGGSNPLRALFATVDLARRRRRFSP